MKEQSDEAPRRRVVRTGELVTTDAGTCTLAQRERRGKKKRRDTRRENVGV